MRFNIITIFPDLISHYAGESILARGQRAGVIILPMVRVALLTTRRMSV